MSWILILKRQWWLFNFRITNCPALAIFMSFLVWAALQFFLSFGFFKYFGNMLTVETFWKNSISNMSGDYMHYFFRFSVVIQRAKILPKSVTWPIHCNLTLIYIIIILIKNNDRNFTPVWVLNSTSKDEHRHFQVEKSFNGGKKWKTSLQYETLSRLSKISDNFPGEFY